MGDGGIGVDGAVTAAILKLGSIGLFERTVVQIYILDQAVRASFKAGQFRAAGMHIAEVQVVDVLHFRPLRMIQMDMDGVACLLIHNDIAERDVFHHGLTEGIYHRSHATTYRQ